MFGYEVLRKVVDGSAAEVFLAREEASDDRVLLEVIRPELTHDAALYGRFIEEAKERQQLAHPNLVLRRSAGHAPDGRVFVVTEPVPGENMGSLLRTHGPLAVEAVLRTLIPICDALGYLHERSYVHGCLRPSNIYPGDDELGRGPKLVDTGLFLLRSGTHGAGGRVLVEPEYLSPERVRGKRADAASDIYGLGVLMFELLTGLPPFSGPSAEETRRRHLAAPVPPMPEGAGHLAPIIRRCLAKKPSDRYQSATFLRQALMAALRAQVGHTPRDEEHTLNGGAKQPIHHTLNERGYHRGGAQALQAGELLGAYRISALLGEGGMGRVYLGEHTVLGRQVALKVLHPDQARDPAQLQRFFHEARAVNQISHEHIVEISDLVEDRDGESGHVYCVMEYLKGMNLKQLAQAEAIPVKRAVALLAQVCDALGAAHRLDVVHRDIKPDNIFIIERGAQRDYVKVLDFGVAKLTHEVEDFGVTRPGSVVGTPTYMSPEQASGKQVDARSDVYAVGVVLYQLLSGRAPFEAPSLGQLIVNIVTRAPAPLLPRTPTQELVPVRLRAAVMRCLRKHPEDRYPDMETLRQALVDSLRPDAALDAQVDAAERSISIDLEASELELVEVGESEGRRAREISGSEFPTELELPSTAAPPAVPTPRAAAHAGPFGWLRALAPQTRALVMVLLGTGLAFLVSIGLHLHKETAASASAPVAAPSPEPSAAVAPTHSAAANTVVVQIVSRPAGARVVRSDSQAELGITPVTLVLARDAGANLDLGLILTGCPTELRRVRLDQNASLEVALCPGGGPRGKKPAHHPGKK